MDSLDNLPGIRIRIQPIISGEIDFAKNALLAFLGQDVSLVQPFFGDRLAEIARQHKALSRWHAYDVMDLMRPEDRIEEVPPFLEYFEHHALVGFVRGDDLVLGQVCSPAMDADEVLLRLDLDTFHFPVPELLQDD